MPRVSWLIWLACGVLLAGCAGCARDRGGNRYIPPEGRARQALETALAAWRDGAVSDGRLVPGPPAVQVVDTHRREGQQLRTYEILGAVPAEGGHRCFVVRLLLDNPAEEQKARFLVLGIEPLWVFRQEDWDRLMHWEMDMPADPAPAPEPTPKK
jgi:hypothetical protein